MNPMDVISGIALEDLHKQLYDSNLEPKEIGRATAERNQDYPNGIRECGSYNTQRRDINLDIFRVRFIRNKIWNAT